MKKRPISVALGFHITCLSYESNVLYNGFNAKCRFCNKFLLATIIMVIMIIKMMMSVSGGESQNKK